jgi:hypothetical protein
MRSEAAILARSPDVCSFPDSGGKADILQPLLGATSGLMHRSNYASHYCGNGQFSPPLGEGSSARLPS